MKYKTLEEFAKVLEDAEIDPKPVFGTGAEVDSNEDRFHVFCHPDRNPDQRDLATKLFSLVTNLAERARGPEMVVKSSTRQYTFKQRLAVGDVADVYLAAGKDATKPKAVMAKNKGRVMFRAGGSVPDQTYLIKVNRIKGAEALLEREHQVLTKIEKAAVDQDLETMTRYYPTLVESFPAMQGFQRRVNVFMHEPNVYTLDQVMFRQTSNLIDPRHSVWIFKRLMTALAFAHRQGIVHAAVTPKHILVHPVNHQVQVIGWGQSVDAGQPIKSYSKKWKYVYPSAAFDKKPAQSGADIHMAASCLLGSVGFTPAETSLRQFFIGCTCEGQWSREVDGFELYDELDHLAKRVYGEPKFAELRM